MKNQMLNKFMAAKETEIKFLEKLKIRNGLPDIFKGERPDLIKELKKSGPVIIAEYKKASPSRGVINSKISARDAAAMFFQNQAGAVSVLTEEKYFQGSLDYIDPFVRTGLPVLRKDFIFHPLQIRQTAATRASALLLIVRVIQSPLELKALTELSLELGLEPVVEVFNRKELDLAVEAGARVILVNNRDLDRLEVDLNVSRNLVQDKSPDQAWICASGLEHKDQIAEFAGLGFDAFLIGTSIMAADDPGAKLRDLTS